MKKLLSFLLISISAFFCLSCEYYSYGLDEFFYRTNTLENRTDKLLNLSELYSEHIPSLPDTFSILVITDVHFGGENQGVNPDRWEDSFFNELSALKQEDQTSFPLFCVCLGDVAEHGKKSEFKDFKEQIEDRLLSDFNIETFNTVGNHDLYNSGYSSYKDYCFPFTSFYYFETESASFYFLDSASCSLGNKQFTKIQRRFSYDEKPKFVFMHVPLYADGKFYFSMQNTDERNKIISLFAKNNVKAVIDGHLHEKHTSDLGKFTEYNLPGYLEDKGWSILTVTQSSGEISCITHYAD